MKLNDIKRSKIEDQVVKAYTRDSFIMEVLTVDGSIKMFKYDNIELMERDIFSVNKNAMLVCVSVSILRCYY